MEQIIFTTEYNNRKAFYSKLDDYNKMIICYNPLINNFIIKVFTINDNDEYSINYFDLNEFFNKKEINIIRENYNEDVDDITNDYHIRNILSYSISNIFDKVNEHYNQFIFTKFTENNIKNLRKIKILNKWHDEKDPNDNLLWDDILKL